MVRVLIVYHLSNWVIQIFSLIWHKSAEITVSKPPFVPTSPLPPPNSWCKANIRFKQKFFFCVTTLGSEKHVKCEVL